MKYTSHSCIRASSVFSSLQISEHLHRESCLNPIHTPSAHPMATSPRPSGVSEYCRSAPVCNRCQEVKLTERNRTSNLARKLILATPSRFRASPDNRWNKERVTAQCFQFKHLVRLLNDLPQAHSLLELRPPFCAVLRRFCIKNVRTTHTSIVMNRTRKH